MLKVLSRVVIDAAIIALLLFASAGSLNWGRAWILVALLLVIRLATAFAVFRVNPGLLRERAGLPIHAEQPVIDRFLIIGVLATGFGALPALAGFDVFRRHLLPRPA